MKIQILLLMLIVLPCAAARAQHRFSLYFNTDADQLTPQQEKRADSFWQTLAGIPDSIRIRGFCDSTGSRRYNLDLSRRRAVAVWNYYRRKNAMPGTETITGLGFDFPVAPNRTPAGRQLNRRVELLVYVHPAKQPAKPEEVQIPPSDTTVMGAEPPPTPENVLHNDRYIEINERDTTLRLKDLNFVGGQYIFLPSAFPPLEHLMEMMLQFPNLKINIEGHICCSFSHTGFEFDLSVNRARIVRDYLLAGGIDSVRMTWKGFGGTRHLVPEYTEADRTRNRRVEIRILNLPDGTNEFRPFPFSRLYRAVQVPARADSSFDLALQMNPRFPVMDKLSQRRIDSLVQWLKGHQNYRLVYSLTCASLSRTSGFTQAQARLPLYYMLGRNIPPERLAYAGYEGNLSDREMELRMQYYGRYDASVMHVYLIKDYPK